MKDAFDIAIAEASEQGSNNWHEVRAGRFTSSEMHRLMKSGYREMTPEELKARPKTGKGSKSKFIEDPSAMSEDTLAYIYEKVAETLTGIPKQEIFSAATQWGEEYEPIAAEHYEKVMGVTLEPVGFVRMGDHAGGTADRKVSGSNKGIEIKCPFNSRVMIEYLMLTDHFDLRRMFPAHYWQIQSNLLFTAWDSIYFVAYDWRMSKDHHKMKVIEVPRMNDDIDLITVKLANAVKEKLAIIDLLK